MKISSVLVSLQNRERTVLLRFVPQQAVTWCAALTTQRVFETIPDVSALPVSLDDAREAAFSDPRTQSALWNHASIGCDDGEMYYSFWNTMFGAGQPVFRMNAHDGEIQVETGEQSVARSGQIIVPVPIFKRPVLTDVDRVIPL
jgi:hypothetical protein